MARLSPIAGMPALALEAPVADGRDSPLAATTLGSKRCSAEGGQARLRHHPPGRLQPPEAGPAERVAPGVAGQPVVIDDLRDPEPPAVGEQEPERLADARALPALGLLPGVAHLLRLALRRGPRELADDHGNAAVPMRTHDASHALDDPDDVRRLCGVWVGGHAVEPVAGALLIDLVEVPPRRLGVGGEACQDHPRPGV